MKQRCYNPKCKAYKYYGARGITVCDEWRSSFETFISDLGPKPSPKHSIHRIDNDGNYEPSNCKWATAKEQAFNTRKNQNARINRIWVIPDKTIIREKRALKKREYAELKQQERMERIRARQQKLMELRQQRNESLYKLAVNGTRCFKFKTATLKGPDLFA